MDSRGKGQVKTMRAADESQQESAEAAAKIQYAIFLLREKFLEIILAKFPDCDDLDFNNCIRLLKTNKGLIPGTDGSNHGTLVKQLERARRIRNGYSHQNFDIAQFQHDVECLEKVAALVGLHRDKLRLSQSSRDNVADWEKLKADGNKFYKQAKWREAMDCYTNAISLNPKAAALYSNRALCELQLGKWELAREDAEDAIELDPGQVKYYRTLSQALFSMSLLKDAIEVCTQGLALVRTDVVLRNRLRDSQALIVDQNFKTHPAAGHLQNMSPANVKNHFKGCIRKESDVLPDDILELDFDEFWISHTLCRKAHIVLHAKSGDLREKEKDALRLFETAAGRGYAEGLYNVGIMHKNGSAGLPRDFERALEYFHQAAIQKPYVRVFQGVVQPNLGVAEAETSIGIHYRDGLAVDQNDSVAFKWFLRSAQHGCSSGMNSLGVALQDGKGCTKNLESARMWFSKAADLGVAEAQVNFAEMLVNGYGGPVDVKRGAELLKSAADQGLPGALAQIQALMRSGYVGATEMTTAHKLVKTKSEQGDKEAVFLLGVNYHQGSGGYTKNLDKAEEYLRKASVMKHPRADTALGFLLLERRKNTEALQYIKKAAETTGDQHVQHTFGMMLAYGHGCEKDEKLARRWLIRSGKYGNLCRSNVEVENFLKLASEVLNFEKSDQLKAEGLTLGERTQRYLALGVVGSKNKKHGDLLHKASLSLQHGLENPPQLCGEPRLDDLGKLPEMVERARQGSKTAEKYLQAKELLAQAIIALRVGDHLSSFHLFRKSWRLWDLIQIPQHICRQALKAAQDDFDSNPTNANALFSILIFEPMTKRGCDHRELVEMAKICVSLDPKVADYHRILGCLYGFAGDFENGRRSIERALDLEVEPGWLYDKATMLRLTETEKPEVVIKAYQDYIEANEKDERKIPEAYYSLGFTHLFCMKNEREARECRKKARKAERPPVRLPCFGPVEDDFPPKLLLDTYFKTKETMGDHNILEAFAGLQVQATAKSDRGMPCKKAARDKHGKEDCTACASCGNVGAQSWCGRCKKVWYCDRQCQKQHWKEHKKTCD